MHRLLFVVLLFSCTILAAQDFKSTKNTLLSLDISLDEDLVERLDSYKPITARETGKFSRNKKALERRIDNYAIDAVYELLAKENGFELESTDALKDYALYGDDGLPVVLIPKNAIKKAINKGYSSDYFFVIDINTDLSLMAKTMKAIPGKIKPEVTCKVKIFDANREIIKKVDVKYKASKPIKWKDFPGRTFDKLEESYMNTLAEKLKPMIEEAVKMAGKKL